MSGVTTPWELLRAQLREDAARPLVTYYDDATGERVELSVATFDNWVAKTAGFLQDGLGVPPGDRVLLLLPLHWQALVVAMACWTVGAEVTSSEIGGTAVAFVAADRLLADPPVEVLAPEVVAVSLAPLGAPVAGDLPAGTLDFAVEVPAYADRFTPMTPPTDDTPGWVDVGSVTTLGALVDEATAVGLAPGTRGWRTVAETDRAGVVCGLLAPLAAGGSVVLVRNADPDLIDGRRAAEKVTADLD